MAEATLWYICVLLFLYDLKFLRTLVPISNAAFVLLKPGVDYIVQYRKEEYIFGLECILAYTPEHNKAVIERRGLQSMSLLGYAEIKHGQDGAFIPTSDKWS